MKDYKVYGPYPVVRTEARNGEERFVVSSDDSEEYEEVCGRYGCYVFATRRGGKSTPWYAGKTTRTFAKEIFAPHKLDKLQSLKSEGRKGELFVFLIASDVTRGAKAASATDDLESYLINQVVTVNPDSVNIRKRPKSKWQIVGVTVRAGGRPSTAAATMRTMLVGN